MKRALFPFCAGLLLMCALSAQADDKAQRLVQDMAAATKALTTLTADIELNYQTPGSPLNKSAGTFKAMRPNYALLTVKGTPTLTLSSDGASRVVLNEAQKYTQAPADKAGKNLDEPWWGLPFRYFFTQSLNPFGTQPDTTAVFRYVGSKSEKGEELQIVEVKGSQPMPYVLTLSIGSDKLLHRTEVVFPGNQGNASFGATLTRIKTNSRLKASGFRYQPPKTAVLDAGFEKKLLAVGKQAPEFDLPTATGERLSLTQISKGTKATLINFWYLNCPPCRKELPQLQKLLAKLSAQGLNIVAVNKGDGAEDIRQYWKGSSFTLPVVRGNDGENSIFRAYGVEAFPVNFLLDSEGKIVYRSVGYDEKGLEQALEKLGFRL